MLIIAFGDIHDEPNMAGRIPGLAEADYLVLTGDLTLWGGRREARAVLDVLKELHPRIYAQIGNMDKAPVDTLLSEMEINLNGRGVRLGEVGLLGLGGSNITPFGTPSEFSEEVLEERLWKAFAEVKEAPLKVLFSHTPPANTRLDRIRGGSHVGSLAVRRFLEQTDCNLCICGHIHEAVGTDLLGGTILINPGMLAAGGYVRVESDGKQLSASLERF